MEFPGGGSPACLLRFSGLVSAWGVGCFKEVSLAMPLHAMTPLQLDRPITEATTKAREKYWDIFHHWVIDQGIDLQQLLDNHQRSIEELNILLVRFGRQLYNSGKSCNQYAETINALAALKPAMRRMLQQSWDLACSWARKCSPCCRPRSHHIGYGNNRFDLWLGPSCWLFGYGFSWLAATRRDHRCLEERLSCGLLLPLCPTEHQRTEEQIYICPTPAGED